MPATKETWLRESALPARPTYDEMLHFFGIPPYSADRLDDNIAKKRRDWYAKTSSGNPRGREKAKQVVGLIQRISEALKRGTGGDVGGGATSEHIPDEVFATLEDLWRVVSAHVFNDDYDAALRAARRATEQWANNADSASVFAWVVSAGYESGNILHPSVLAEGLGAAQVAVNRAPRESRNWESQVSLLFANGRTREAITATENAGRTLPTLTPRLLVQRTQAFVATNDPEQAMVAAVRAVHESAADAYATAAVRSLATSLLVGWLAKNLLPIRSIDGLHRYVEMVGVAAWCSDGVPEAEDLVRPHRMWAANADQRVFTGSWQLRSFLAVLTDFISLPIHNAVSSTPAWQVLLRGLDEPTSDWAFRVIARPKYVQDVHNIHLVHTTNDL